MLVIVDCYRIRLIITGLAIDLAIKLAIILINLTFISLISPRGNSFYQELHA